MKFVTRKQLLNRACSAADLDAFAEFWLRLYETAAAAQGFTAQPEHRTEVRLRGFPRAEGPLLADELARRAKSSDFRRPVVELLDLDTLGLASDITLPAESPPLGLGLPLFEGPGFDGLMAEIRITATGGQGQVLTRANLSFTLVLVGQIVGGVFVLQALWRTGSSEWEDDVCWYSDWANEAEFLTALDRFREAGEVPVKLAKKICVPRGAERMSSTVVRLIHVPLGRPRFAGLAWRWFGFTVVLGSVAAIATWFALEENWGGLFFLVALTWWWVLVFWFFVRLESRLWFVGYRLLHEKYSKLYREPHRFVPPPPELTAKAAENPTVQKYTSDLQAAGFTFVGDLVIDPQFYGERLFRIFRAPDGVTHVRVNFIFTTLGDEKDSMITWPAQVSFVAHTVFADGGYALSVNGRLDGYLRKRTGPEVLMRVFPDETDVLEFVRKHTDVALDFARKNGHRMRPNSNFAEYVRQLDAMLEEEQRQFIGNPYTWGDHVWWYLQTPRKVYRE